MTKFKDLKVGAVFDFWPEYINGLRVPRAHGPWVKISPRKYRRYDEDVELTVGSVHTEVKRTVLHMPDDRIEAVKIDRTKPKYGMAADGYTKRGGATTDYFVRLVGEKRWYRVYVIQVSNAGSIFIKKDKLNWFLSDSFYEGKIVK